MEDRQHRILIVENSADIREIYAANFTQEFGIDFAQTGQEALAAFSRVAFDGVLLDRMLPDMDAISLISHFRPAGNHGGPVVFIVSGRDRMEDRVAGLEAGATDYIVKPFELAELTARLKTALYRRDMRLEFSEKPERRLAPRIPAELQVQCSAGGKEFALAAVDLSVRGMRLYEPASVLKQDSLKPGVLASFSLKLPTSSFPLSIKGRVAWCRELNENGAFVGVQFVELEQILEAQIVRFIQEQQGASPKQPPQSRQGAPSGQGLLCSLAEVPESRDRDLFAKARTFKRYFLDDADAQRLLHTHRILLTPIGNRVIMLDNWTNEKREMIMMGSCQYLNLNTHPRVIEAGVNAMKKYGPAGHGAILSGKHDVTRALEQRLAAIKGGEDALVFPTGYAANLSVMPALLRRNDLAIVDEDVHASLLDGWRLSSAGKETFHHNDVGHLDRVLELTADSHDGKLVVIDGVYSMNCDLAPIPEILSVVKKHKARLMVDDAQATGVIGRRGYGTSEHFGVEGKVDLYSVTFNKALGCHGGAIVGSSEVIDYLKWHARSYVFSTAISPVVSVCVHAALDVLEQEPWRLERLRGNVRFMAAELRRMGFNLGQYNPDVFQSANLQLIVSNVTELRLMSRMLHDSGIWVSAIEYPAVPKNRPQFRIGMMATHTQEDMERALESFHKSAKAIGLF